MGSGFLEQVYVRALVIELLEAGLQAETEARIVVRYRGQEVGVYFADILVNECVIIEIKAVEHLVEAPEVQLVNYLRATRIEVGLLVNFGVKLELRRRIFTNDRKTLS
jgi:GxxExxY protein